MSTIRKNGKNTSLRSIKTKREKTRRLIGVGEFFNEFFDLAFEFFLRSVGMKNKIELITMFVVGVEAIEGGTVCFFSSFFQMGFLPSL